MTEHLDGERTAAERLAAKLQSLGDSLSDDERALFESVLAQAAAHPDAVLAAAESSALDVSGHNLILGGRIGPPPPPPGGVGGGQPYLYLNYNVYYFR